MRPARHMHGLLFEREDRSGMLAQKRKLTSVGLYGVTSQKMTFVTLSFLQLLLFKEENAPCLRNIQTHTLAV